jgi:hypothetical protein
MVDLHYEPDDYVHEHPADDAVNANYVASWRVCGDAEGHTRLCVDLHPSDRYRIDFGGPAERLLRALESSQRGRFGMARS